MSSETVIDPEAIENLRSLTPEDPDSFLRDIIGIFIDDTPQRFAELHKSLTEGDRTTFTRAAHSIKGSASNLGALQLYTISADLEKRSRTEELATLTERLADLENAFTRARRTLEELVKPA
jgi:histidine phosphotransfer protein HptB